MASTTLDTSMDNFPLLDLPREPRDLIYHFALVRECLCIPQVDTVTDSISRTTWNDNRFASSQQWFRTYSLYHGHDDLRGDDTPQMNLLKANRQLYSEASEVSYSKNIFSFDVYFRLGFSEPNPVLAFLTDSPQTSLENIPSLEIVELGYKPWQIVEDQGRKLWSSVCMYLRMTNLQYIGIQTHVPPAAESRLREMESTSQDQNLWAQSLFDSVWSLKSVRLRVQDDYPFPEDLSIVSREPIDKAEKLSLSRSSIESFVLAQRWDMYAWATHYYSLIYVKNMMGYDFNIKVPSELDAATLSLRRPSNLGKSHTKLWVQGDIKDVIESHAGGNVPDRT
ncbi:uncharacterized protein BDZ99DRAFT_521475 [Mytilinidion resinicola]|uniref:F-box domain-containing protein n=1 Tax=Mytilinidion resinicola TaxID=574789 RepID=A0A6A6YMB4_9PEZI|nr:uncharacterized protein BDZ99DRAFT_521475 [Mytilinidion resinicola]KAF2809007.1 hypothetical protein BDZ99DRAFT_521475 [Mytilinidion resinicola]